MDCVLTAIVVGFAFLAASAPAHNSDLWLHLATGREFVEGKHRFGVDPFAQGTAEVYWVNTNWLYDVVTYLVFRSAGGLDGMGGAALVLLKAIAAAVLAAVLLRLGWCGRGLWAPAVGAAAAVLALCPWLAPHPMIVSYLFLALTLYFLERPHGPSGDADIKTISFKSYWPLLPLFVLWVNLDSWFLLGPLTVALYLLGQLLQSRFGPGRDDASAIRTGEAKALCFALAGGLVACLINPFHVYAFLTPPAQLALSPAAGALQQDAVFQGMRMSPFQAAYLRSGGLGWNAGGLAYFALALLGGLSFVLNSAGWRWRRFLACAALFLLSAFRVRAIPLFAVAAGPMLALNVQEFFTRRTGDWMGGAEAGRWAAFGRGVALLAGLALLVLGWPGWLHAPPFEPPRWAVEVDPGLRQTAVELATWRRNRIFGPEDLGFNLSPDAANTFAWFCPEEKGVLDARHPLFSAATATDLVKVRQELAAPEDWKSPKEASAAFVKHALAPEDGADPATLGGSSMAAVREVLRRRGADHLIVYDTDPQQAYSWFQRLQQFPDEWPLLTLGGRCAVFGWRDPEGTPAPEAFAKLSLDLDRLAFQPPDEWKAPRTGRGREPAPPDWSDAFLKSRSIRSARTDEASLYLQRFDQETPRHTFRSRRAWKDSLVAAVVGTAVCANGSVVAPYALTLPLQVLTGPDAVLPGSKPTPAEDFVFQVREDYVARQDQGPTALLYLALRAARRAVHDNPDDANAYLILGGVYKRLLQTTTEGTWNPPQAAWDRHPPAFPLLYRVRTAEAIGAYKHALSLEPNLEQAHTDLISLYQDMNYQDELLVHLKELHRCNRQAGLRRGENPKQFSDRILDLEDVIARKSKDVQNLLDAFEVKSTGAPVASRAQMAFKFGLAGKALSILLPSDVADFGAEGMALELELLLHVGRLKEVRTWPDPVKAQGLLGTQTFMEIQLQLEAASGNYQEADADLKAMLEQVQDFEGPQGGSFSIRAAMGFAAGQVLLLSQPWDGFQAYVVRYSFYLPSIRQKMGEMTSGLVQQADLTTLRGVLALEGGEVGAARGFFHQALSVWGDEAKAAAGGGLDFPGRVMAQAGLEKLTKASR